MSDAESRIFPMWRSRAIKERQSLVRAVLFCLEPQWNQR